jgi:hypothetical protein
MGAKLSRLAWFNPQRGNDLRAAEVSAIRRTGQPQAAGVLATETRPPNNHGSRHIAAELAPRGIAKLAHAALTKKEPLVISPIRIGTVALVVVVSTICQPARAQEQQQPPVPQATEAHKLLQKDVGTWDAEITLFPGEGAEPAKSKGTETCKMLKGDMWLMSHFEGEMAGMEFAGAGMFGYDPTEKKYVGIWADSMSPHMMTIKGEYDAATNTMTSTGEGKEPSGGTFVAKLISRYLEDGTRTFEMHMRGPNGEFTKMMAIKYKRRAK